MGTTSSKKKRTLCCSCFSCTDSSFTYSSSSSCSIDEKYLPTFDRLSSSIHSNGLHVPDRKISQSEKKMVISHFQSIENLEKSLHTTTIIDQWIDSLPILGTPSLNRTNTTPIDPNIDEYFIETQDEFSVSSLC